MDEESARALIELNRRFYERHAASFSATREGGWPGWHEVVRLVREKALPQLSSETAWPPLAEATPLPSDASQALPGETAALPGTTARPLRVLDVACGNLRFERFLANELADTPLDVCAVDSCEELMREGARRVSGTNLQLVTLDILEELLAGGSLPVPGGSFDLVACFGFMHHVPGEALRQTLLRELVRTARPGGIVAVSFWQFMDDERLAARAQEADGRAASLLVQALPALEAGDHFLGWQNDEQALRYCHHFTEAEIDTLAHSVADDAHELARFSADGKTGRSNRYLVLERL